MLRCYKLHSLVRFAAEGPTRPCAAAQLLSCRQYSSDSEPKKNPLLSKLLYRSKQRGWLELDLLMGLWAEQNLPKLSEPELKSYSELLDEENPALFKWLTGQEQPPAAMEKNPAFQAIRAHIQEQIHNIRPITAATAPGKEWVRGWGDTGAARESATSS